MEALAPLIELPQEVSVKASQQSQDLELTPSVSSRRY